MTTFPAELTDRIIDFLHSDKRALSECSLVCKSWVPASRYHLFREIVITRPKALSILELFRSSTAKDNTGANGEPSPSISDKTRQFLKGLGFLDYVQSVSWQSLTYITDEATLEDPVMQIIASFPRLSEFTITRDLSCPTLRHLRNIKKFSDHRCNYSKAGTAIVIANNPGLEHLDISKTQWGDVPSQQLHDVFADIPPNYPLLKLRHIRATGFSFHPSIMPHLRSLTSLDWGERSLKYKDLSAELWQTLKSEKIQLSRLKASLSHDSLLEFLSSFQGMKDLRLKCIIGKNREDSDRLARTLLQVVCLHHADTLETFHINGYHTCDWCFVHHDITPILNCTNLRELGASVYRQDGFESLDATPVFRLLNSTCELPRLRLLQIKTINNSVADSKIICDAIYRFDPGAIRIPVVNVLVDDRRFEWRERRYSWILDF